MLSSIAFGMEKAAVTVGVVAGSFLLNVLVRRMR